MMPILTCRRRIEESDPPIKSIDIECFIHKHSQSVRIKLKCHNKKTVVSRQQYYVYNDFRFDNIESWTKMGQALGSNNTLKELSVNADLDLNTAINPVSARCLEAFYDGLKENRSIEELSMDIFPSKYVPMFDLGYFIRNNSNLKDLNLSSEEQLTGEQCLTISNALKGASLRKFNMHKCKFMDSQSFEQVMISCPNVKALVLRCQTSSESAALASLLQDPKATLSELHLYDVSNDGMPIITTSLRRNTTVKKIYFWLNFDGDLDTFAPLLCDASTLESIRSSNHVLEEINTPNCQLPQYVEQCLMMNRLEDKDEVIQKKLEQLYQVP